MRPAKVVPTQGMDDAEDPGAAKFDAASTASWAMVPLAPSSDFRHLQALTSLNLSQLVSWAWGVAVALRGSSGRLRCRTLAPVPLAPEVPVARCPC